MPLPSMAFGSYTPPSFSKARAVPTNSRSHDPHTDLSGALHPGPCSEGFMEEDDGQDLGHREEHGDDDSGEQRRAVVDGADYAEAEALVHGGCAVQEHVVARLAEFGLSGFSWDCLRHNAQICYVML